eukprot:2159970-Rhodomonas_salina.2
MFLCYCYLLRPPAARGAVQPISQRVSAVRVRQADLLRSQRYEQRRLDVCLRVSATLTKALGAPF